MENVIDSLRTVYYYIGDYSFLEYVLLLMGNFKILIRIINDFMRFPMFIFKSVNDN